MSYILFHQGIFHENAVNLVGNGVVIDPVIFKNELDKLSEQGVNYSKSLLISRKAHLILPTHRLLDAASEASKGKAKIGSTLKGIGPTYMDKTGRNGIRIGDLELDNWEEKYRNLANKHQSMIDFYNVDLQYDLIELETEFFEAIKTLKSLKFIDSEEYLQQAKTNNKSILAEGAQGSLLDIDFGTYPFVTSSNTTAAGACTGLGVSPTSIKEVFEFLKHILLELVQVHSQQNFLIKMEEIMAKLVMNLAQLLTTKTLWLVRFSCIEIFMPN